MPRGTTAARSRRKFQQKRTNKKEMSDDDRSDSGKENKHTDSESEPEYQVEKIVAHRIDDDGNKEYNVKWQGFESSANTWEPCDHLSCDALVQQYEDSLQNKKSESAESLDDADDAQNQDESPEITTKRQQRRRSLFRKKDDDDDEDEYEPSMTVETGDKDANQQRSKRVKKKKNYAEIESDNDEEEEPAAESAAEEEEEVEETYTVEAIRKHRKSMKSRYAKTREDGERCMEYFVKWENWDESTNTWEHESELASCQKLIDQYWEDKKQKEEEKKKAKIKKRNPRKTRKKQTKPEEPKPKQMEKKTKKPNFKAKRVAIVVDPESDEDEVEQTSNNKEASEANGEKAEIVQKETELISEDEEQEEDMNVSIEDKTVEKNPRKRALCDADDDEEENDECNDDTINEPPLKKRRMNETRALIEKGGVDMFLKLLDEGNSKESDEPLKEALMDLVEKINEE